jgi:hypothetical protein
MSTNISHFAGVAMAFFASAATIEAQTPPAQSSTIRAIRFKLSAGDLPRAESILERPGVAATPSSACSTRDPEPSDACVRSPGWLVSTDGAFV